MTRGDMLTKSFVIRSSDGTPYTETLDNIYLTVKKSANDRDYKFQKRLSDNSIESLGEGRYQFTIEPEDTDPLQFEEYAFDIELYKEDVIKRTFYGKLKLEKEVTHYYNEVM